MAFKLSVRWLLVGMIVAVCASPVEAVPWATIQAGLTYYVSSSEGNDGNDGLSEETPFSTVSKVNTLALQPGDRVLFKCGDVWRADPLIITTSGDAEDGIIFAAYPSACENRPVLSGAQPISGWIEHTAHIYVADLTSGDNAGKCALGLNQLFQAGVRLPLGRWPNLDAGDGGYATIDAQPAADEIADAGLPAVDWTGAVAHIRGMRWYILNREVTGVSGSTLTLGAEAGCWGESCAGWGYFLNNHLSTLDQEGEWYYDATTHRVYVYTTAGVPADGQLEGAVILRDDDWAWGGVVLGIDYGAPIAYITLENLDIRNWYLHGITTPTNLRGYENQYLTIQNNMISNVDGVGINLATWVYSANDGEDGWRGGNHITVSDNVIDGANHRGIDTYTKQSEFTGNIVRNIGLIENLGKSGMGCDLDASGGACTEDGDGIRIKVDEPADSGNHNLVARNRLERVAYNGMDVFGYANIFEQNVIYAACYAKGDCGGIRTFGRDSLSATPVYELTFHQNLIVDTSGNTDGCIETYKSLFGFGLYIDNYSRDVVVDGNTIISSTAAGILYQRSTGSITSNTLYNNSAGTMYSAQVVLSGDVTHITAHNNNVLYALKPNARTLSVQNKYTLDISDHNYFFNPYVTAHIAAEGTKTLTEWQTYSGLDANSIEVWFALAPENTPRSRIFYNDSTETVTVELPQPHYFDLDQHDVIRKITLPPFSSQILVSSGDLPDLSLEMALLTTPEMAPGAPLTYTLTVANQGIYSATGVVLTHAIPSLIADTAWSVTPGLAGIQHYAGSRYSWLLPDLAPAMTGILTITGTYTHVLQTGVALALSAQISTEDQESVYTNNTARMQLGTWWQVYIPVVVRGNE
ncbi:MAG: right-handed parallel beta-helix repeat-containing protein [Anaerolineae bacterium]|nr:right-handed parallel beta-helix repeat-containing protein [Anaerolineae bacterium]